MVTGQYNKDREVFFKWVFTTIGLLGISFLGMMLSEQKETNRSMVENRKDIEFIKEKNQEQDRRLNAHDDVLFIKPDEPKLRFEPKNNWK